MTDSARSSAAPAKADHRCRGPWPAASFRPADGRD